MKAFFSQAMLALSALLASMAVAAQAPRPMVLADYFAMASVSEPRVSPEGGWLAYTVSRTDLDADESSSRIWMLPMAGGTPIPMTTSDHSSWMPRWSPDGRYLAFLSSRNGAGTQVWLLNRYGGEAEQLTATPQSVQDFAWSPDGQSLVLVLQDLSAEHAAALAAEEEFEHKARPIVIDRIYFKEDYTGYLDRRRNHLYRFDLDERKAHALTGGDFDDSAPVWSPDGQQLAFVSKRVEEPDLSEDTDIFVIPAAVPEAGVHEPRRITRSAGSDSAPAWSPDGQMIVHRTTINPETPYYETPHLALTPVTGGVPRLLTEALDRNVYAPRFSRAGDSILFLFEDNRQQVLARVALTGGAPERLIQGRNVVYAWHEGSDGQLAVQLSRPDLPGELFRLDANGLQQLTFTNKALLAELQLGQVEAFTATTEDGTTVESLALLPPGYKPGRAYPTVLDIHGGPQSQYDYAFSAGPQLLAAQGYVVLLPNPRGSTGRGYDYCVAIFGDWNKLAAMDVMAVVDEAIARGWSDAERLGVMGWSYGGILTNHLITVTDRFKAAATGASVTQYSANYGHDQYVLWWETEFGKPWEPEAAKRYAAASPFYALDKVTTPTLVLSGDQDWNVPIINSEQLYLALRRLGVETQLIVYPGEYHGIDTPSMTADSLQRHMDWFGRLLVP